VYFSYSTQSKAINRKKKKKKKAKKRKKKKRKQLVPEMQIPFPTKHSRAPVSF